MLAERCFSEEETKGKNGGNGGGRIYWLRGASASLLCTMPHLRKYGRTRERRKKKSLCERVRNLQQRQRHITLQTRLELHLDVEIQPQLEAHGLGIRQAGEDCRLGERAGLGEGLVVVTVAATAAAARAHGRGDVGGGVIELFCFISSQTPVTYKNKRGREKEKEKKIPGAEGQRGVVLWTAETRTASQRDGAPWAGWGGEQPLA